MIKISSIIKSPYLIVFLVSICSALPSFMFGNLGFYGDDFNMLDSLKTYGFLDSIKEWQEAYGYFYRPIGIAFLLSVYAVLGDSSLLMYCFSFFTYTLLSILIYRVSYAYFKDINLSIFITIFFSAFPFNAASFLQLSSLYMIFTSVLFLVLLDRLCRLKNTDRFSKYAGISLLWFVVLFSYEQVTGLVLIILCSLFVKSSFNQGDETRNFLVQSLSFIFITLIFMVLFFGSSGNPKVSTLESLNEKSSELIENEGAEGVLAEDTSTYYSSRVEAVLDKIDRTTDFLLQNTAYAINKIFDNNLLGLALYLYLLIPILLILRLNVRGPPKKLSGLSCLIGFVWMSVTLAPFLLYQSVHIPPYVLLLPAIGLSLLMYGIFWLAWPKRFQLISVKVYKIFLCSIFLFFQINQFGIYFGIKEELSYWAEISYRYNNGLDLINIKPKGNNHLFWSEKLYGHRHFFNLTGESVEDFEIIYSQETNSLTMLKKNKLHEL